MEKRAYEQYAGKPKDERRETISASGALDRRRFLLSNSPEWKDRIRKLQDIVYELKKEYPEIISLSLYGSLIKGYASAESDIDAYLNIDEELRMIQSHHHRTDILFYIDLIKKKIQKELGLEDFQVAHLFPKLIDKNIIANVCRNKERYGLYEVFPLFLLSIGRDINEYRKIVFDELKAGGVDGEIFWISIMDRLEESESGEMSQDARQKRRLLYPRNLAEGRKYFLQESKDGIS